MTIAVAVGMQSEAALVGERPGIVTCVGAGSAVALAASLEAAIASGADRIVSVGVVGALNPMYQAGDVVVGKSVSNGAVTFTCDPGWRAALWRSVAEGIIAAPYTARIADFCGSPGVVVSAAAKAAMRASTGADVADMETWTAAMVAKKHDLPFAALRAVSDPAGFSLPPAALTALNALGSIDIEAVAASLEIDPGQIPELMQLDGYTSSAYRNLGQALARAGDDFSACAGTS